MSLFDDADDFDAHGLAGLYALDALEGDDLAKFESALANSKELRSEVAEFRATAATLSEASVDEPSEGLRDRVLDLVSATRQDGPVVDLSSRRGARLGGVRASWMAAAAALIVVAGVFGYIVRGDGGTTTSGEVAALLARPDARLVPLTGADGRSAQVVVSLSKQRVVVVSEQLAQVPDDKAYALWAIGGKGPVLAGLFRPNADGRIESRVDVDLSGAQQLGVTVEPKGGSDQPTTPILVSGAV